MSKKAPEEKFKCKYTHHKGRAKVCCDRDSCAYSCDDKCDGRNEGNTQKTPQGRMVCLPNNDQRGWRYNHDTCYQENSQHACTVKQSKHGDVEKPNGPAECPASHGVTNHAAAQQNCKSPCAVTRAAYGSNCNGEPDGAERFAGRKRPDEPDPDHAGGGSAAHGS
jgi:hypothetical protein